MKTVLLILLFSQITLAQTKQISFIGLTLHGVPAVEPGENEEKMKSRLDKSSLWAYNPQFNYTYYKGEDLTNLTFLSDCYANAALNFAKGKRYQYNDKFYYGYIYGLYFRYNPNLEKNRYFNIMGNFQLIPNAAINIQYKITERIVFRITSNYIINFFDIAYEF